MTTKILKSQKPLVVYTDGACSPNPGKGGWGAIALFGGKEIHLSGSDKYTTNNIMELTAVIEALENFQELLQATNFLIYSDSKYVINCAQKIWARKKNVELWGKYDQVSRGKKIEWVWVKGHNGDIYNEKVDALAREESRNAK